MRADINALRRACIRNCVEVARRLSTERKAAREVTINTIAAMMTSERMRLKPDDRGRRIKDLLF
jgi:hypothetical protein